MTPAAATMSVPCCWQDLKAWLPANQPSCSFTANQPSCSYTANQPSSSYTTNQPSCSFTANQPSSSYTANQPTCSFTTFICRTMHEQSESVKVKIQLGLQALVYRPVCSTLLRKASDIPTAGNTLQNAKCKRHTNMSINRVKKNEWKMQQAHRKVYK